MRFHLDGCSTGGSPAGLIRSSSVPSLSPEGADRSAKTRGALVAAQVRSLRVAYSIA